jgi:hypothetical protein
LKDCLNKKTAALGEGRQLKLHLVKQYQKTDRKRGKGKTLTEPAAKILGKNKLNEGKEMILQGKGTAKIKK